LAYTSTSLVVEGRQYRNLEAGADVDYGGLLLTGLFLRSSSVCFLIEPRTTSPAQGWHYPQRALSPWISNWENALQLDLMGAFPQLKPLSLW
jgi:hypothetical protein